MSAVYKSQQAIYKKQNSLDLRDRRQFTDNQKIERNSRNYQGRIRSDGALAQPDLPERKTYIGKESPYSTEEQTYLSPYWS